MIGCMIVNVSSPEGAGVGGIITKICVVSCRPSYI